MREVKLFTNYNKYAEGSCLIYVGDTHVICTVSVEEKVPPWLRDSGSGWITAEYGMLPRATNTRTRREASNKGQGGRTHEIQRLIGRSLRAITNLKALGEIQLRVDCDVIQADGGTRTASITGSYVALHLACQQLLKRGVLQKMPITSNLAAVSCGIFDNVAVLDLDYAEDSAAHADTNFVLTEAFNVVEIQATAEEKPFSEDIFNQMLSLAKSGVSELIKIQKTVLKPQVKN